MFHISRLQLPRSYGILSNMNVSGIRMRTSAVGSERRRGQTMVEYLIVAGVLLGVLVLLSFLLVALKLNGNRVLDLVASEYP